MKMNGGKTVSAMTDRELLEVVLDRVTDANMVLDETRKTVDERLGNGNASAVGSYSIIKQSLWHPRKETPEVMRDVLLLGYLEGNKPVWTVYRFPTEEAYLRFIVDGGDNDAEYEEWAYCNELYQAVMI